MNPFIEAIFERHQDNTLFIDIMFINNAPFLVTTSQGIHFRTVEALTDKNVPTIEKKLQYVFQIFHHRGFQISTLMADIEFEAFRPWYPMLNLFVKGEHIPAFK